MVIIIAFILLHIVFLWCKFQHKNIAVQLFCAFIDLWDTQTLDLEVIVNARVTG